MNGTFTADYMPENLQWIAFRRFPRLNFFDFQKSDWLRQSLANKITEFPTIAKTTSDSWYVGPSRPWEYKQTNQIAIFRIPANQIAWKMSMASIGHAKKWIFFYYYGLPRLLTFLILKTILFLLRFWILFSFSFRSWYLFLFCFRFRFRLWCLILFYLGFGFDFCFYFGFNFNIAFDFDFELYLYFDFGFDLFFGFNFNIVFGFDFEFYFYFDFDIDFEFCLYFGFDFDLYFGFDFDSILISVLSLISMGLSILILLF